MAGVAHLDPRRVADFPVARPRKYVVLLRTSMLLRPGDLDLKVVFCVGWGPIWTPLWNDVPHTPKMLAVQDLSRTF